MVLGPSTSISVAHKGFATEHGSTRPSRVTDVLGKQSPSVRTHVWWDENLSNNVERTILGHADSE